NKELLSYLQRETVDQKLASDKASFIECYGVQRDLHWFPTRRCADLGQSGNTLFRSSTTVSLVPCPKKASVPPAE
ncbi:hypothetical protein GH858_26225, partial [Bacillus thuringiensis]|nr:hypothetical protein [Bacillus thuringiensis]